MHFDEDAVCRHLNTWQWLLENFGGIAALKRRQLILPTSDFFSIRPTRDHAFAQKTFAVVREWMGMSDWPCELQQFEGGEENNPVKRHGLHGDWTSNGAAGFYLNTDEGVLIAYSSSQLDKPGALVSTLSHELCHYMLQTAARSHPPGGWQDHELHTDTACGFMGFGIFACNAAFDFQQWGGHDDGTSGWRSSRQGYLSESEHAYSLALFCVLTGASPHLVAPHLKKNPREYFDLALRDIESRPADVAGLLKVRCLPESLPPILSVESPLNGSADSAPAVPAVFTSDNVAALGPQKPWYAPLATFYLDLIATQDGDFPHDREFAALNLLQPLLRDALLVIRFTQRFDEQGLQGAIILEDAEEPAPSLRMLQMTAAAFESLSDMPRAGLLQALLPAVPMHFEELEKAERDDTLDEFFSPLDHDESWRGFDFLWNHELRRMVRDKPAAFVHPPG